LSYFPIVEVREYYYSKIVDDTDCSKDVCLFEVQLPLLRDFWWLGEGMALE
jgi:hypothetical protein